METISFSNGIFDILGNKGSAKLSVEKFGFGFGLFNELKNIPPIDCYSPKILNAVG